MKNNINRYRSLDFFIRKLRKGKGITVSLNAAKYQALLQETNNTGCNSLSDVSTSVEVMGKAQGQIARRELYDLILNQSYGSRKVRNAMVDDVRDFIFTENRGSSHCDERVYLFYGHMPGNSNDCRRHAAKLKKD